MTPSCVRRGISRLLCSGLRGSVLRARDARPAGWRGRRSRKSLRGMSLWLRDRKDGSMVEGGLFALIVGRIGGGRLDVRPQIVDMQVAGAVLLASLLSRFVPSRIPDNGSLYRSFPSFDAGDIYPDYEADHVRTSLSFVAYCSAATSLGIGAGLARSGSLSVD